jgi:DNA polymerase-4
MDRLMLRPVDARSAIVAHVDLNSFFATVEQQANPLLRGKAVGVCAYLHKRGAIIAASIEAKRLGMKVGMTVEQATKVVPGAIFVQNDPPKYRTVGEQVFTMLSEMTDLLERYSIDEAFLDLTDWYETPMEVAQAVAQMRKRMKREIGEWLDFSVGIAPTRFLAKTGSDFKKPGGTTIINSQNLEEILSQLKMEDVCGIGPRTRRRLENLGYRSLLEVKRAPVVHLMHAFGKRGYFLWSNLNGLEVEGVDGETAPPKSIGHSYCVPRTANREGKIEGILAKLTDRASRRLRREGLLAGALSVAVGFRAPGFASPSGPYWRPEEGEGGSEWLRLTEPLDDSFSLVEASAKLLRQLWHGEQVNFLAVTLFELSEPTEQLHLNFERAPQVPLESRVERRKRLSDAVDSVRDRHGETSVQLGRMFRVSEDDAPDRIGFRKL